MRVINLGNGKYAMIDNADEDLLSLSWVAHYDRKTDTHYAARRYSVMGSRYWMWLHREIMERVIGRDLTKDELVDHKNRDKLDCTRKNLRVATRSQNEMNKTKSHGKSKYKGVSFEKRKKLYRAVISIDKKYTHIGYFNTDKEAALAYNKAAKDYYGEFAYLNEIEND